jgi:hypothetical protein
MVKSTQTSCLVPTGPIDCACVIHGDAYTWNYVDRLYNMLSRNITPGIRLHVYTEADRPVPEPYIKHTLADWGISGPKKSWWYKMQLFNPKQHQGPLLYFDLDTVIVSNIDWIWQLPLTHFWTVKDFKYLWKPWHSAINSSVMWWDTQKYAHVWKDFSRQDIQTMTKKYHGDQDYLTVTIPQPDCKFFDERRVKSWRWQSLDGGYDFRIKAYKHPSNGTTLTGSDSILVFHGKPKPNEISDPVVLKHWQ